MKIIRTVREYQLKEANGKYFLSNGEETSRYISNVFKDILLNLNDARFWHEAKDRIEEDNFEEKVDLFIAKDNVDVVLGD